MTDAKNYVHGQAKRLNTFGTVVFEVSSFLGHHVQHKIIYKTDSKIQMFFLLDLGIGGEGGLNLNPSSPGGLLNPGVGVGVGLVGVGEPQHMMNNNLGFQTHILPDMIDCQGYNILLYPFYQDRASYYTPFINILILFYPFIRI